MVSVLRIVQFDAGNGARVDDCGRRPQADLFLLTALGGEHIWVNWLILHMIYNKFQSQAF